MDSVGVLLPQGGAPCRAMSVVLELAGGRCEARIPCPTPMSSRDEAMLPVQAGAREVGQLKSQRF